MTRDYEIYMESEEWKFLKGTHPDPHQCIACGYRRNLELHHMRYPANIWDTQHADCCWLCHACHETFHRALITGRAQGFRLDGTGKAFTKRVIQVQKANEEKAGAGVAQILPSVEVKGILEWFRRGR